MLKSISMIYGCLTAIALVASAIASCPARGLAQSPPSAGATPQPDCLLGYPDGSFREDRSLSRDELAAGMSACLEELRQLLPTQADFATRTELQDLLQRQQELNQQVQQLHQQLDRP